MKNEWKGQGIMGKVLEQIREELMAERDMEESIEDPDTAVKSVWNTADSSMGSVNWA